MIETISTSQSCTLVLRGRDWEHMWISLTRSIMVHLGRDTEGTTIRACTIYFVPAIGVRRGKLLRWEMYLEIVAQRLSSAWHLTIQPAGALSLVLEGVYQLHIFLLDKSWVFYCNWSRQQKMVGVCVQPSNILELHQNNVVKIYQISVTSIRLELDMTWKIDYIW